MLIRRVVGLLACLSLVFSIHAASSTTVLFAPGETMPRVGFPPVRPGKAELAEYDGRKAIRCSWDAKESEWYEFSFQGTYTLPDIYVGEIVVELWQPADCKAEAFNLRLADRDGETTQFTMLLDRAQSGWQSYSFELDTAKKMPGSWGKEGTLNKQFDLPIRVAGVSIRFADKESAGEIGLGAVRLKSILAQPSVELITGTPIHILRPGDEAQLALAISNPGLGVLPISGRYVISDAWQATLHDQPFSLPLPAGRSVSLPLPVPTKRGVYYVDITLNDSRQELSRRVSYSYMTPAGPTTERPKGFLFGVQSHSWRYPVAEQKLEAQAMALCGAKIRRCSSTWAQIQPKADDERNFAVFGDLLAIYEQQGLDSQVCFLSHPSWARDPNWQPANPDYANRFGNRGVAMVDLKHYGDFVHAFMTHFRHRITYVESWNEPDLLSFANFSVENYIAIMKVFYESVKKASPEARVMTGGYTALKLPYPERSSHPDHMALSMAEAKGFYEIHAFHGHGSHARYVPQIIGLRELHRQLGLDIPWWANETAVSAINIGELAQAETLFKKLLFSWAQGAMGYNWYDLRNDGYDPKENEHNFGLITKDFYPKQAYAAYNALVTLYREAQYLREYTAPEGMQAYLFQAANGDYLIPSWCIDFKGEERLLTLSGINGSVHAVDIFGNETAIASDQGLAFVVAGKAPTTIRVSGQQQQPELVSNIITAPQDISVHPRRDGTFALSLHNPTAGPLQATVSVRSDNGYAITPAELAVDIAAGTTRQIDFSAPAAAAAPAAQAAAPAAAPAPPQAEITVALGEKLRQQFSVPLRYLTVIGKDLPEQPTFVLKDSAQLHSTVVNEPGSSHLFWKGPADLSAAIRLACKDGILTAQVGVTDDKHSQPFTGRDAWKGDNVQLAIATPGQDGMWEIGLTRLADGQSEVTAWAAPKGVDMAAALAQIILTTTRDDERTTTTYTVAMPLAALGIDAAAARQGIAINVLINDNDEGSRESFLVIAPGLGRGDNNSSRYPVICCE